MPYEAIELSVSDFYEPFVDSFNTSSTRHSIFQSFEKFILHFQKEIVKEFVIWIDGSFVTKKENPNDIDLLIFLDFDFYQKNQTKLNEYKTLGFQKETDLDLYFLIEYPPEHKNKFVSDIDRIYWLNQFSKTAPIAKENSFLKVLYKSKLFEP